MFATMSALEIIEQIKALPREEQAAVVQFIHQLEAAGASSANGIHFATPEAAEAAGDKVVKQYAEVFRKLAQ
jgi:hypothetical protein